MYKNKQKENEEKSYVPTHFHHIIHQYSNMYVLLKDLNSPIKIRTKNYKKY